MNITSFSMYCIPYYKKLIHSYLHFSNKLSSVISIVKLKLKLAFFFFLIL
jgi:hypothetical protein